MPIPTPFHLSTAPRCVSHEWHDWAGYLAAGMYGLSVEWEYYAIRNAAALIDITPLYKYEISGPDALRLLNRVMTRDVSKCAIGQIMYSPWCDDEGKVVDDGTIQRLEENRFRVTAADPNLRWFQDCGEGMEASVADISADLAALALQGPLAQDVLASLTQGVDLEDLKYFHLAEGEIGAIPATITRTGYTGDLGYELWVKTEDALPLWEALIRNEAGYNLTPTGLAALDMARIEAGLLLIEVDFISTHKALIEDQRSSPYEIGLGWTVALDKGDFIGRRALLADKEDGVRWKLVGLEVSWTALETLFGAVDLPPQVTGRASRSPLPVYKNGLQIGQVTSSTFSPILKKYIALASLERPFATLGSQVDVEVTVEYGRRLAQSQVVPTPFYDPPQKRA